MTHIAKLFKNGRSQAVRLPAEFRFEGDEVYVRRDESTGEIILTPKSHNHRNWSEVLKTLAQNKAAAPDEFEDFMEHRCKFPPQERHLFKDDE